MNMSEIRKQLWQNPSYARKILISRTPNKKEQKMIEIIQKNNFPFKYVSDGKFIIEGKCPDFIDFDNKRIIEVFGNYWHTKKIRNAIETEEGRKQFFSKYGFDTFIVWENELNNEKEITNKIKGWIEKW